MTTTPKPEPVMTPAEAHECLDRFNTSHWNKYGRRARYSIPASPMDDDIRMAAFIDQAEADRARIRELEEVIADAGKCVTMREVHEALAAARAKEESK